MRPRKTTAAGILVAGFLFVVMYYARVAFIPIALAALLALVLSGAVEALYELRIPRALSAITLMLVVLGCLAGLVNVLSEPAQAWFAAAPHTLKIIERKVRPIEKFMSRVDDLRNSAGNIGIPARAPAPAPAGVHEETGPVDLIDATRGFVLSAFTVVVLTLFLLAGGPPMLARMTSAVVDDIEVAHVISVIDKVRREVGRFYVTTAIINIALGGAVGVAMMVCGMPNPYLWGAVAGLLNFIPYAGPTLTLILLAFIAVVSFDGFARVFAVVGSYLALVIVEGQLIQPFAVGRRLQLNPMLVFLSLWFGGLYWGIAGIFLATPTLATLKVIAENSAGGRPVVDFLSPARH